MKRYSDTSAETAADAMARFLEVGRVCYGRQSKQARQFAVKCMDEREELIALEGLAIPCA